MGAEYRRGPTGLPEPVKGGVKTIAKGRFKQPAHGWVLLERANLPSPIIAPTAEAAASFSVYRVVLPGSETYALFGQEYKFNFVKGECVVLMPNATLIAEPSGDTDSEGRPLRVIVQMFEVVCSVEGWQDGKSGGGLDA